MNLPNLLRIPCEDFIHAHMQTICQGAYQWPVAWICFMIFTLSPVIVFGVVGIITTFHVKNK